MLWFSLVVSIHIGCFRTGKKGLLGLFGLVFGMEIGFKLATKQLIWLLNPCHMLSMLQLFLMVSPNNIFSAYLFRWSLILSLLLECLLLYCQNSYLLANRSSVGTSLSRDQHIGASVGVDNLLGPTHSSPSQSSLPDSFRWPVYFRVIHKLHVVITQLFDVLHLPLAYSSTNW